MNKIIPKGAMFIMSEGCYSDYSMMGLYIAKEDIYPDAFLDEYKKLEPIDYKDDYNKRYKDPSIDQEKWSKYYEWKNGGIKWLLSTYKDLFEKVPYYEWHVGDYEWDENTISDNTQFIGGNGGVYK